MGRRRERKRRVLRERFSSSEEDEVDNLEPEPRTCADLFLGCVGWLLTRLWPVCRPLINLVMWPSRKLGINPPVPLLLTIFYAVYVLTFSFPFAFCSTTSSQLLGGTLLWLIGVLLVSSTLSALCAGYPLPPAELRLPAGFGTLPPSVQLKTLRALRDRVGGNKAHIDSVCLTCNVLQTERCHHCSVCGVCLPRMDHHCVALNRCVHYENQKQFTLLFTYMMLFCLVNLLVNWQAMQRAYTDVHQPGWWLNNLIQFLVLWISLQTSAYYPSISHVYITMDIAILAIFLVLFPALLLDVWYCIYRNSSLMTCNKSVRVDGPRFPYVYLRPGRQACFRKPSARANFEVIFGPLSWRWLLPWKTNVGNGWLHSCTCNEELKLRRVKCKRPSGDMLDDLRYEFSDDE